MCHKAISTDVSLEAVCETWLRAGACVQKHTDVKYMNLQSDLKGAVPQWPEWPKSDVGMSLGVKLV
jgi:hypothetical protein